MKNIVVPTDLSPKSFSALMLAKSIARKTQGTIHLIHIVEPVSTHFTSAGEYTFDDFEALYARQTIERVGEELQALSDAHKEDGFAIDWEVNVGDPYAQIRKKAKSVAADLVVIGSKGVTDSDEFFLGSLTDKVVRNIPCPVVTVKAVIDDASFEHIVYATDLNEDHEPMMLLLASFSEYFNATIHIVRVNTKKDFKNDIDVEVSLKKLADRYELKNYTLNTYSHEDEEYGIVYFADEQDANLIAIGVHEKSGFRRLISGGSIANEVTEHTYRPVLTYCFNSNPI